MTSTRSTIGLSGNTALFGIFLGKNIKISKVFDLPLSETGLVNEPYSNKCSLAFSKLQRISLTMSKTKMDEICKDLDRHARDMRNQVSKENNHKYPLSF